MIDIEVARRIAREHMSEKRFSHSLGVESAAVRISQYCLPEMVDELRVAAILHDIAKEFSFDYQLSLTKKWGTRISEVDLQTRAALHSFAGAMYLKEKHTDFISDKIIDAVFYHTVGSDEMDIFSEIIYVSDFVEEGREYESCIQMANFLFSNLSEKNSREENLRHLHMTTLKIIDRTIDILSSRNMIINERTLRAREKFLSLI